RIGAEDALLATAKDINLVVVDGLRLMMDALRKDLLLRPLVRTRVVLVDESRRVAERHIAEAADHVHLSVDRHRVELLFRLGERRRLTPAQAASGRRLCESACSAQRSCSYRDRRNESKWAREYRGHPISSL